MEKETLATGVYEVDGAKSEDGQDNAKLDKAFGVIVLTYGARPGLLRPKLTGRMRLVALKGQALEWEASGHIGYLIATYGLLAIGVVIALESTGLPLPGESVLVLAALYAAHHGHSISAVVASAAAGEIGRASCREGGWMA